jgi:hypothetical protein
MAMFFVGQRVKLVRAVDCVSRADEYGREGVIESFTPTAPGFVFGNGYQNPGLCDCFVIWDGLTGCYSQHTDQLEPVITEGSETEETEECATL